MGDDEWHSWGLHDHQIVEADTLQAAHPRGGRFLVGRPADRAPPSRGPGHSAPTGQGRKPPWFMQEYDCWGSGETAPVTIPGHAVVAINGDDPRLVGPRLTGHALEHVFEGKHPDLRVIAFCR